jgi:serine/threonine protein kinase
MKRLNHPNIVKYVDTIREPDYLYIILEYVSTCLYGLSYRRVHVELWIRGR